MKIEEFENYYEVRLKAKLEDLKGNVPERLYEVMEYAVFSGGKRVRPYLMFCISDLLNVDKEKIINQAISLECIHSYSLIHDDLPCMDNDLERRGKPTCHNKYGETMALLAGDALLNFAYEVLLSASFEDNSISESCRYIALAAGSTGMIGGQALESVSYSMNEELYKKIYKDKTTALFRAAIMTPVIIAGTENKEFFETFAENVGLAFQLNDDLIDYEKDEGSLAQLWGKSKTQDNLVKMQESIDKFFDNFEENEAKNDLQNLVQKLIKRIK